MWKNREARGVGLVILTGLIVSWVRHGLQHHWLGFDSWGDVFVSWFIHTLGVSIFSGFAAAAIMGAHKFFVGAECKEDMETLAFYVVMTVLLGAFAVAILANVRTVDDDDARLLLSVLFG